MGKTKRGLPLSISQKILAGIFVASILLGAWQALGGASLAATTDGTNLELGEPLIYGRVMINISTPPTAIQCSFFDANFSKFDLEKDFEITDKDLDGMDKPSRRIATYFGDPQYDALKNTVNSAIATSPLTSKLRVVLKIGLEQHKQQLAELISLRASCAKKKAEDIKASEEAAKQIQAGQKQTDTGSQPSSQNVTQTKRYCSALKADREVGLTLLRAELDDIKFSTRVDQQSILDRAKANMKSYWAGLKESLAYISIQSKANAQAPGKAAAAQLKSSLDKIISSIKSQGAASRAQTSEQIAELKSTAEAPGIAMRAVIDAHVTALKAEADFSGTAMKTRLKNQTAEMESAAETPRTKMLAVIDNQIAALNESLVTPSEAMNAIIDAQKQYYDDLKEEVAKQEAEFKQIQESLKNELAGPDHGMSIDDYDKMVSGLDDALEKYQAKTAGLLKASGCK